MFAGKSMEACVPKTSLAAPALRQQGCHPSLAVVNVVAGPPNQLSAVIAHASLPMRLVLSLRQQACHPSIAVVGVVAALPDQLSAVTAVAARVATLTLRSSTLLF